MTAFEYSALDGKGRTRSGVVHALSEEAARALLMGRRLVPVHIGAGTAVRAGQDAPIPRARLHAKTLALFTRQLATLARAVPLEEALRTLAAQSGDARVRAVLSRTHADVMEGMRLSTAMARQGNAYPAHYRAMIAAGESAGALPDILDRLAELQEREYELKNRVATALIYPAALSATAIAVVAALLTFVVPRIAAQYDSMGRVLPLLTRLVIGLSAFLVQ